MKKNKLCIIGIFLFTFQTLFGQDIKDTVFTSVFRGNLFTYKYKVVSSSKDNSSLKLTLAAISVLDKPYYILSQSDFTIYQKQIVLSHKTIDTLMKAVENFKIQDNISEKIKIQMEDVVRKTNERVDLYKKAYEEMVLINQSYSQQLTECVELQRKKVKTNKFQYFIWGMVGGGLIGTYVGFQAVR